jgi:hypothetical protein
MRNKRGVGKEKQLNTWDVRFIVIARRWGGDLHGGQF